jgi:hypothetical protein
LTPAESRFVAALETALGSNERAPTVRMTSGGTLPWRAVADSRGRVEYRFPRRHKLVKRMVEAYAENPAYLYPALVLLSEGEEGPVNGG